MQFTLARTLVALLLLTVAGCTPISATRSDRIESVQTHASHHVVRADVECCRRDDVLRLSALIVAFPKDMPDARAVLAQNVDRFDGCRPGVEGIVVDCDFALTFESVLWLQARGAELELSNGCAIPVSDDGYFLTAAHVLDGDDARFLVVLDTNDAPTVTPFRVVWSSRPLQPEMHEEPQVPSPDLALIHAPVRPKFVARLADDDAIEPEAPLIAGRAIWSTDANGETYPYAAGVVVHLGGLAGETPMRHVCATMPVTDGDSGGPMILEDGTIAAVVSGGLVRHVGAFRAIGWRMTQEELDALIARDRTTSREGDGS